MAGIIEKRLTDEQLGKIAACRKIWIRHDRVEEGLNKISNFIRGARYDNVGYAMEIIGLSGAGKTSLLRAAFPNDVHKETGLRSLTITVPEQCKPKELASGMLFQLQDPYHEKGTKNEMENRIRLIIQSSDIQCIIFDELQHLVNPETGRVNHACVNWIKTLLNRVHIPVILVGLQGMKRIFSVSDEMHRRQHESLPLLPFSWRTNGDREYFMLFLISLNANLPIPDPDASALLNEDVACNVIEWTGGLVGFIIRLICKALSLMMMAESKTLKRSHLEQAYELLGGPSSNRTQEIDLEEVFK